MNYSESNEYWAQQAHRRSSKKGVGDPRIRDRFTEVGEENTHKSNYQEKST